MYVVGRSHLSEILWKIPFLYLPFNLLTLHEIELKHMFIESKWREQMFSSLNIFFYVNMCIRLIEI